jgi:Kazal-type serine protease inhibitor-like protein
MKTSLILRTAMMLSVVVGALWLAAPGASAAGPGQFCGGIFGVKCDKGLFCQFPAPYCGAFDRSGTCTRIPRICPRIFKPVCGCNGKTYANDCVRQAAGVSLRHPGKCP